VLGFDDLDWAAVCDPPLSTLHLPTELMGRLAAQALVQRLDHGLPIRALKLEAGFVGRASTAPPSGRTRR
jgi:DNA-binding LacI/PurR family transcriptional regulator